jgi:DNA-binding protein YbaB
MKSILPAIALASIVSFALVATPAQAAKEKKKEFADGMVTVYISGHGGTTLTKKMNEMHVKMESMGWRFAGMEVHTENSDTEGMWVTYVK